MPKKKRWFLCQGCKGNMTGEITSCGLVSCSFAGNQEVQAEAYREGDFFESCKHRKQSKLQMLAKIARDKGTCNPQILAPIEEELGIPPVN